MAYGGGTTGSTAQAGADGVPGEEEEAGTSSKVLQTGTAAGLRKAIRIYRKSAIKLDKRWQSLKGKSGGPVEQTALLSPRSNVSGLAKIESEAFNQRKFANNFCYASAFLNFTVAALEFHVLCESGKGTDCECNSALRMWLKLDLLRAVLILMEIFFLWFSTYYTSVVMEPALLVSFKERGRVFTGDELCDIVSWQAVLVFVGYLSLGVVVACLSVCLLVWGAVSLFFAGSACCGWLWHFSFVLWIQCTLRGFFREGFPYITWRATSDVRYLLIEDSTLEMDEEEDSLLSTFWIPTISTREIKV